MDKEFYITDLFEFDADFEKMMNEDIKKIEKDEKMEADKEKYKLQMDYCVNFFNKVADLLSDIYEVVRPDDKKNRSRCLVPKGTASQVTYYGKPVYSLRVGAVWNWRASLKKCNVPEHIQCVTRDLPYVKGRPKGHPELPSPPIYGNMVAIFDTDKKYHCIYGEKYDKKTKTWMWVDNTPERAAMYVRKKYVESLANQNTVKEDEA